MLVDLIFLDKTEDSSFVLEIFPSFNPSSLIQQFIPLVSFPSYFSQLYSTLSGLETRARSIGLSLTPVKQRLFHTLSDDEDHATKDISIVMNFILKQCLQLLPLMEQGDIQEDIGLLLLYIQPLFEHPTTSFEAVLTLFEPLSTFLSKKLIQQTFLIPFLNVFDQPSRPFQRYNLLNRAIANTLLTNFGLSLFLSRFLGSFIEAVIEPVRHKLSQTTTRKEDGTNEHSRSISHRMDLSHASNPLSPSGSSTAKHSLSFTWREEQGIHSDDEDSDPEEEFGFPEASLFESSKTAPTSSVFGLLADIEETNTPSQTDGISASITTVPVTSNHGNATPTSADDSSSQLSKNDSLLSSLSAGKPLHRKFSQDKELDNNSQPIHSLSQTPPFLPQIPANLFPEDKTVGAIPISQEEGLLPPIASPRYSSSLRTTDQGQHLNEVGRDQHLDEVGGDQHPDEVGGEEEAQGGEREVTVEETKIDPHLLAVGQHISKVAADCLRWLLWRLGPLLSTKHIVGPFLDGFHR